MKKLPLTRKTLRKLTRKINDLESQRIIGYAPSGTGVKAFAYEIGKKQENLKKASILRAQRNLVESGLIEIEEIGNHAMILLTDDGVIRAIKDKILNQKHLGNNQYCLIVFDIPEHVRGLRQQLRRLLSELEFIQLQLSVWYIGKNVSSEMQQLLNILKLNNWVKIFSGHLL